MLLLLLPPEAEGVGERADVLDRLGRDQGDDGDPALAIGLRHRVHGLVQLGRAGSVLEARGLELPEEPAAGERGHAVQDRRRMAVEVPGHLFRAPAAVGSAPKQQQDLQLLHGVDVVVQEAVLAQYEAVCEAAGLIPQEVDVSSLRLFNLWAQELLSTGGLTADFLWVNATDGGVTAFIFHQGTLVFLRSKLQTGLDSGGAWLPGSEQAGLDRIVQECADSIYACQQQTPDLTISQAVLIADEQMGQGLQQQMEKGLGVPVKGLDWEQVKRHGGGVIVGPQSSAALPAIAGVV